MANFALNIEKFAKSFSGGAEQAVRGASIKLFSAIIQSTPVDQGRARGNWFTTGQQPSSKISNSLDKTGSKSTKEAEKKILSIKDYSVFTLTNNLPYIEKLEFGGYGDGPKTTNGYSKQSPNGMVRLNAIRFNNILNTEAKKVLPK